MIKKYLYTELENQTDLNLCETYFPPVSTLRKSLSREPRFTHANKK